MVFGDPYRFAILTENIPSWNMENGLFFNGLFYYIINGKMFPEKIKTSTLSIDIKELIDTNNALVSCPENDTFFSLPAEEAFKQLYQLNYPESTIDNEYPEQDFTYNASTENLSDDGVLIFAIADYTYVRILAAKTERLTRNEVDDNFYWKIEHNIEVSEVIIPKTELRSILKNVENYYLSISS